MSEMNETKGTKTKYDEKEMFSDIASKVFE